MNRQVFEILHGQRHRISLSMAVEVAERLDNDVVLVNLDRRMGQKGKKLRRQLLRASKRHKVVPVSFLAVDRPSIQKRTIEPIEVKRRECVFKAQDYNDKWHYYLSGFDRNEPRPLYFLAELPREVTGIKDAREALKPPSVVAAEDMGRVVFRQGDMFAIPTKITTEQILKQGGIIEERETNRRFRPTAIKARKLYGTAHTASKVALMPDGTCLAWGRLYHEPSLVGRTIRDHRPCLLRPRRWHLVARNTVPVAKREPVRVRSTSFLDEWDQIQAIDRQIRALRDW